MRIESTRLETTRLDPGLQMQAGQVLSRAFFNDPLMLYYLPDPEVRHKALPVFMRIMARYCLAHGEVWTTPGLDGVACWLPPGRTEVSMMGMVRASLGVVSLGVFWSFLRQAGARNGAPPTPLRQLIQRVNQAEGRLDEIHKEIVPGQHWYLLALGVDADRQGRGIGSRLIASQLERARLAGLPCYLETGTELDVAFYIKNGFQVAHQEMIQPGNLHMWSMVRWP
jgi:GNAT superfamily N-acetyltransferase